MFFRKNPGVHLSAAIEAIRQVDADAAGLDFDGGAALHALLDEDMDLADSKENLRKAIKTVIKAARPWWLQLAPYGRERLKAALRDDELQCFREAGLFDSSPAAAIVEWWDELAAAARSDHDAETMIRARDAERLSLEFERTRLMRMGIELEPDWVSLDDNTLGYDIRSYDVRGHSLVTRLIEVKSTLANSIVITRNEWSNASSAADRYYFHVWKLPERVLEEIAVSTIREHIPINQGAGEWERARINLGGS